MGIQGILGSVFSGLASAVIWWWFARCWKGGGRVPASIAPTSRSKNIDGRFRCLRHISGSPVGGHGGRDDLPVVRPGYPPLPCRV